MKNRIFKNIKNVVSHPVISLKYLLSTKSEKNEKKFNFKNIKNVVSHPIVSLKYALNSNKNVETKVVEDELDSILEEPTIEVEKEEPIIEIERDEEIIDFDDLMSSETYNKEVSWDINFDTFLRSSLMTAAQKNDIRKKVANLMSEYPELKEDLIDILNEKDSSDKLFDEMNDMVKELERKGLEKHIDAIINENTEEKEEVKEASVSNSMFNDDVIVIEPDNFDIKESVIEPKVETKKEEIKVEPVKVTAPAKSVETKEPTVSKELEEEISKDILMKYTQKELEEKIAKYESKITEKKMLIELCDDAELKAKLTKKLNKHILKLQSYKLKLRLYIDESIKLYESVEDEKNMAIEQAKRAKQVQDDIQRAKDKADYMLYWYKVKDEELSNLQAYSDEEITDFIENGVNSKIGNDAIKTIVLGNPKVSLK